MKSNTSIGKASRSYFVSLDIMFCYMEASNEWKTAKQIALKDTEINKMRLYDTFYHVICIISIMEMDLPAYNVQDSEQTHCKTVSTLGI